MMDWKMLVLLALLLGDGDCVVLLLLLLLLLLSRTKSFSPGDGDDDGVVMVHHRATDCDRCERSFPPFRTFPPFHPAIFLRLELQVGGAKWKVAAKAPSSVSSARL
jgi:hypothetical protein